MYVWKRDGSPHGIEEIREFGSHDERAKQYVKTENQKYLTNEEHGGGKWGICVSDLNTTANNY